MDQTFNAALKFDKSAEVGDAGDGAFDALALRILVRDQAPRVRRELLDAQGDLARLAVNLENLDVELVPGLHHFRRLHAARVGHVGDVQQAVHAAEIDECAEVGERADGSAKDRALFEPLKGFGFGLAGKLFENDPAIHDDVFISRIELGDAALDCRSDQRGHFGGVARAAAGGGHEGPDAHVDTKSALDHFLYRTGDVALGGVGCFQPAPVLGDFDADGGKQIVAGLVAAAHGDDDLRPRLQVRHGIGRQHAVHLASNVDKSSLRRNRDHRAFDGFAAGSVVRLFEFGKDIAEGAIDCRNFGCIRVDRLGHAEKNGVLLLCHTPNPIRGYKSAGWGSRGRA